MRSAVRLAGYARTLLTASKILNRAVLVAFVCASIVLTGCSRPSTPSLVGANRLHDISQIRRGMSPNEVRRVMGGGYKNVMEEGIRGMDGGNYTWVYPEGKVYFGYDGVTGVDPSAAN